MSTEQNKQIVQRALDELWNKGNLAAADELYAASYIGHNPASPQPLQGAQGIQQFVGMFRTAFSNIQTIVEDQMAEGDKVVTRWQTSAVHTGDLMGIPASGKPGVVTGISINQVVAGRIVAEWTNWDQLGMLQQIGVIPTPGQ